MLLDVHQHLWSAPLLDALAERRDLPFVCEDHGLTVLHLVGEQPYVIDRTAEAPERRAALVGLDGLDRALVCLSGPLGIEALPRAQARPLLDAYLDGALALPEPFGVWAPVALDGPDPRDVDGALARGCVGVSCPAGALGGVRGLAALRPVLERLEALGAPLFVHPGPAPWSWRRESCLEDPLWWPALTDYVADMAAAWYAFVSVGRREHPRLRVLFAMLAGLAPLQGERLRVRGGPAPAADPLCFYDCSSYGSRAVAAVSDVVGPSQIVFGSDRPVADPAALRADLGERFEPFALRGADLLVRSAGAGVAAAAGLGTEWPSADGGLWTERPMTTPRDPATISP
jgi:6-methylsalicylate decarboxylase